jgi:hypothetical protein
MYHVKMKMVSIQVCLGLILASSTVLAQTYPSGIEHVIVIGIDGMSPDGIKHASTPVMHNLIASGSVKWNVRTVLPSSSSPNWASMIMGGGTELHGITDNDWGRADYSLPPILSGDEGIFPTIFGVIRKYKPASEIGAVYQWEGFGRLFEKKAVNYDKNCPDEDATTKAFISYIIEKKPLFGFMHLDHVDGAGHQFGHGTPLYYKAVSKADSLIGEVLRAIRSVGMDKNTLLIITADHGGIGYGHGGATVQEAEIAMILSGKCIKKGYVIKQQVYTYDLAATIAFALKMIPPYAWTGRPIKSAFDGFNEPTNLWPGKTILPFPEILPARYLYQQAGALVVNKDAWVKIQDPENGEQIRFTLDGSDPDSLSAIYLDSFQVNKTTVVKARSFDKQGNESMVNIAYFRVLKKPDSNGLQVRYYKGSEEWNHLPVFDYLTADTAWISYEFNLDRNHILTLLGKNQEAFGAVLAGYLSIDQPGEYQFFTQCDDGSKLFINGKMVVDNDGDHGVVERSGKIKLDKGLFPIRIEYYNGHGGFWLDAFYKGPGVPKQIIPADKLFQTKR